MTSLKKNIHITIVSRDKSLLWKRQSNYKQKEEKEKSEITESKFEEMQIDDSQVSHEATQSSQESWWSS